MFSDYSTPFNDEVASPLRKDLKWSSDNLKTCHLPLGRVLHACKHDLYEFTLSKQQGVHR